jgi:hypothetical protein
MRLSLTGPTFVRSIGELSTTQLAQKKAVEWLFLRGHASEGIFTAGLGDAPALELWVAHDDEGEARLDLWVFGAGSLAVLRYGEADALGGSYEGLELDPPDDELYDALVAAIMHATAEHPGCALGDALL